MRKSLLLLVLVLLFLYSDPKVAVANHSNPFTPEEKSMLMYKDFLSSCLSINIMEAIKVEYNISQGGFEHKYESNAISYGLHEGHGFVAVVYVRPVDVDHFDRLTFHVKPDLIQYGNGIKLLKYERAVDS